MIATDTSGFSAQANLALSQGSSQGMSLLSQAQPADLETMRKTAEKFTGMFMSQMFSHMFEGVGTNSMFGGGPGEEMFRSELINEYGKAAAKHGGFGLTDKIMHALIAQQEVTP